MCVPDVDGLRAKVLEEAHHSRFAIHPGATKMYHDLKALFWWPNLKGEVAHVCHSCQVCQQVKAEHKKPRGLLESIPVPEWKWEHITMDMVTGLPRSPAGHDSVWVVVDRLTKTARFIAVHTSYSAS